MLAEACGEIRMATDAGFIPHVLKAMLGFGSRLLIAVLPPDGIRVGPFIQRAIATAMTSRMKLNDRHRRIPVAGRCSGVRVICFTTPSALVLSVDSRTPW